MELPILHGADGAVSAYRGPKDFHWLIAGRLGGAPRPGVGMDLAARDDLEALRRVKTCLLVNLTEEEDPPAALVREAGIDSHQHKIRDMGAPDLVEALETCRLVDSYLQRDQACVYHCHGGKGRTGTMLAAQLIFYGLDADAAVAMTRERNPKWIESQEQFDFLYLFAEYVAQQAASRG